MLTSYIELGSSYSSYSLHSRSARMVRDIIDWRSLILVEDVGRVGWILRPIEAIENLAQNDRNEVQLNRRCPE